MYSKLLSDSQLCLKACRAVIGKIGESFAPFFFLALRSLHFVCTITFTSTVVGWGGASHLPPCAQSQADWVGTGATLVLSSCRFFATWMLIVSVVPLLCEPRSTKHLRMKFSKPSRS